MLQGVVSKRFLPYILACALILGVGYWIYDTAYRSGVDDTARTYELKIQKEQKRIQSANQDALENAKEREAELRRLLDQRNITIGLLIKEAINDANADRPSVGPDSVRRINRID